MLERCKWQVVSGDQVKPFLDLVNPIQGKFTASPASSSVKFSPLAFYKDIALVEVNDSAWGGASGPFWFLAKQGRMFLLDGSSAPIHDANEAGPVIITENNALEYMRFFCFFVHGDEGPFFVIEDINHPALDKSRMDPAVRQTIENAIIPAAYEGKTDAGTHETTAMILYGNALFSARFAITDNGMIEMIDDEPIAADLPVRKIKPNY